MYPIYKVKLHNPTMHKLRAELALCASRLDPIRRAFDDERGENERRTGRGERGPNTPSPSLRAEEIYPRNCKA